MPQAAGKPSFGKIALVGKLGSPEIAASLRELAAFLQKRGCETFIEKETAAEFKEEGAARALDYAAIGAVTNLASRLADEATAGQFLISQRLYAEVEEEVDVEPVGEFVLKGFQRPVAAFNVIGERFREALDPRSS